MSEKNLFQLAATQKWRFPSRTGLILTEDLYDLPLTSARGSSLDDTARTINNQIKALGEESFVTTSNPNLGLLQDQLELVKLVIKTKQDAAEAARVKAEQRQQLERINDAIAKAEDTKLASKTPEELYAMREQLLKQ